MMRLEDIIQIIEFTDTDTLAEAMEIYNRNGMVQSALLPYMQVIIDQAAEPVCHRLKQTGFRGQPEILDISDGLSVVYDLTRYSADEVRQRIGMKLEE